MTETVNSKESLEVVLDLIRQSFDEYKYIDVDIKIKGKARTLSQNGALQVYCKEMAGKLSDSGQTYDKHIDYLISKGLETEWSEDNFRHEFRRYGTALYPDKIIMVNGQATIKTSKLSRKEISDLYELVNMRMSMLYGVGMEWPNNGA